MSGLAGIRFVSKEEIDAQKQAAKAAAAARQEGEGEGAKERRREAVTKAASHESAWVAPALEQRLQGSSRGTAASLHSTPALAS